MSGIKSLFAFLIGGILLTFLYGATIGLFVDIGLFGPMAAFLVGGVLGAKGIMRLGRKKAPEQDSRSTGASSATQPDTDKDDHTGARSP